jgi:hypothetical protein
MEIRSTLVLFIARFIIMDPMRGRGNIKREYKKTGRCGKRRRPILEETDASHTLGGGGEGGT